MSEQTAEQAQWSTTVTPVVAALTTLCASTALAGVIDGARWLGYAGIAVIVVTAVGLGLRAVRAPTLLVGLAQLLALLFLVIALFTHSGILGFIPGPTAFGELGDVLNASVETVRLGVPPVPATAPVLCMVVIAIGAVAVLVDTLAVAAGTPAACGLVLLCVYAVPASLADQLLPWWSFLLGAGSFAVLLAVDGTHRHRLWRNRPAMPGGGAGVGSPVIMVSVALVLGLLTGGLATGVGTVGSLPGTGGEGGGGGGLALKPFTALRGMLDQGANVELFRVRGLGNESRYLRAMTLPRYDRNGGWVAADALPNNVPADSELPAPPGDDGAGTITQVDIEPVNSKDLWAPVYGTPRRMRDIPEGMFYDSEGGMVYSRTARKLGRYVEEADLSQPSAEELRQSGTDFDQISSVYRNAEGIDPEVVQLATRLTSGERTMFDKTVALQKYFATTNGFQYKTQTGLSSDEDALKEFLFNAKVGYCEQFASAMAILARAAGIPSRVAIGYTAGFQSGDYRSITTQDAHAWVEIFFPDQGWITFDPTPLSDGRSYEPPYVSTDPSTNPSTGASEEKLPTNSASTTAAPKEDKLDTQDPAANAPVPGSVDESWSWRAWAGLGFGLLALLLAGLAVFARVRFAGPTAAGAAALAVFFLLATVSWWLSALWVILVAAAVPAVVRDLRRRRRRHTLTAHDPTAASAAWTELMAESWDRGADTADTDTVRTAARRLVKEHSLDEGSKQALRTVVNSVERSWYGGQTDHDPDLARAFDEVVQGMRRTSPLDWKGRLLPRSVVSPRKRPPSRDDD
ncbi:DUF3488 and transglutaminase-like domain-containing protein [Actinokineospora sp. NBRC 105648]|uniref:transglutaminase family protein n=1 Tax=Actinokineospora sp. NBRC 105648 TaxID=3032206 RepID=UPI0024A4F8D0|nr:DUF3488 and transglutaminase-like domain-containing protein [Actinokineospora sp. NBRC 105648]GLZ42179.1 hypothetical protein Acsp05_58030 [Actinokineospora sp. NBRC 105648]